MDISEEIITADMARSISNSNKIDLDNELEKIWTEIKKEIINGNTNCHILKKLSNAATFILKNKGYKVTELGGFIENIDTTIEW